MGIRILIPVLIIALSGCAGTSEKNPQWLLPSDTETEGWKIKSPPVHYDLTNMVLYLKQRKTLYSEYGVREMVTAEYVKVDNPETVVRIELYRMDRPLHSFGIFSRERNAPGENKHIYREMEGCTSGDGRVLCYRGPFFIRIEPVEKRAGPTVPDNELALFVRILKRNIPEDVDPLPSYTRLPGQIPGAAGIVYYPLGIPQISGLKEIFVQNVSYRNGEFQVFYARRKSSPRAFREYSMLIGNDEHGFVLDKTGAYDSAFMKNRDGTYLFVGRCREWIFGVLKAESIPKGEKQLALFGETITGYKDEQ